MKRRQVRALVVVSFYVEADDDEKALQYAKDNLTNQLFRAPIDGPDGQSLIIEVQEWA